MIPIVMAISTETYSIEPVELSTADDDLVREVAALHNAIAAERVPEDPPLSFEAFASRVRNRPAMVVIRDWLARSAEGELVGRGLVVRFEADTNQHLRDAGSMFFRPTGGRGSAGSSCARSSRARATRTTSC